MVTAIKFNPNATAIQQEFENPSEWVNKKFSGSQYDFGVSELMRNGSYELLGWRYDFKAYLKQYWVSLKYEGIREFYAPNKTALRKMLGSHNVIKMVEVPS